MTKINLEHREEELNEIASSLTKIPDLRDGWRLSHLLADAHYDESGHRLRFYPGKKSRE